MEKKELNWGATIAIVAAAAMGISSQYTGKASPEVKPPVAVPAASTIRIAAKVFDKGPCVEIEDRIKNFVQESDERSLAAPPSCYGTPVLPGDDQSKGRSFRLKTNNLHFVIATLPDPLHTHFALSFDRLTEAVQEGAADEQYNYDSSWLPWETEETKAALVHDQDEIDDRRKAREDQPGILLFRKELSSTGDVAKPYNEGLVVFVVGEEPTQGIHRKQFENAAAWIAALRTRDGHVLPPIYELPDKILGPSFSGSIPSLANLIIDIRAGGKGKSGPAQPKADMTIVSGSVTSRKAVAWLTRVTKERLRLHFLSAQQNDDVVLGRYCAYLVQSHFQLRHLAIVSEDETAYGGEYGPKNLVPKQCRDEVGPTSLYYPRDISALRSAYQKESIFSTQTSQSSPDAPRRTLTTDIADPEGQQHDTIRNYSGNQTALSQEAILQQIVSLLRVHQAQYILLRSSNPLDQLFLSHYFRLAYPQGRIVVSGADVLLRRESRAARLSGIMTLDTYPLLPWEPHWTRRRAETYSHSHRAFPQDGAEGTYVATRILLHPPTVYTLQQSIDRSEIVKRLSASNFRDATTPLTRGMRGTFSLGSQTLSIKASDSPGSAAKIHFSGRVIDSITNSAGQSVSSFNLDTEENDNFLPTSSDLTIADYAVPFWQEDESLEAAIRPPPTWLSVLGRYNFWPLAALDSQSLPQMDDPSYKQPTPGFGSAFSSLEAVVRPLSEHTAYNPDKQERWHPWPPLPLSLKISLVALIIWTCVHFICCCFPSITKKPNHRAYFVSFAHSRRTHKVLLTLSSFTLSAMATLLGWSYGIMSPDGETADHLNCFCFSFLLFGRSRGCRFL